MYDGTLATHGTFDLRWFYDYTARSKAVHGDISQLPQGVSNTLFYRALWS